MKVHIPPAVMRMLRGLSVFFLKTRCDYWFMHFKFPSGQWPHRFNRKPRMLLNDKVNRATSEVSEAMDREKDKHCRYSNLHVSLPSPSEAEKQVKPQNRRLSLNAHRVTALFRSEGELQPDAQTLTSVGGESTCLQAGKIHPTPAAAAVARCLTCPQLSRRASQCTTLLLLSPRKLGGHMTSWRRRFSLSPSLSASHTLPLSLSLLFLSLSSLSLSLLSLSSLSLLSLSSPLSLLWLRLFTSLQHTHTGN